MLTFLSDFFIYLLNGVILTGLFLLHQLAIFILCGVALIFTRWNVQDTRLPFSGIDQEEEIA